MNSTKTFLLSLFTILQVFMNSTNSQWLNDQSEISNHTVKSSAKNSLYLYVGTISNGIWRSSNNGVNWSQLHLGTNLDNVIIWSIALKDNYVFAGSTDYFFISSNNGDTWSSKNDIGTHYWSIAVKDDYIFVGLNGNKKGVRYSTDNGANFYSTAIKKPSWSIVTNESMLFAGSGDNGVNIMPLNNTTIFTNKPLVNGRVGVHSLAINGKYLYAGTDRIGIYMSTDAGLNWFKAPFNNSSEVYTIILHNCYVFAGTKGKGICVLNKEGESIGLEYTGPNSEVRSFWIAENYLFAGNNEIPQGYESKVIKRKLTNGPYQN